MNTIESPTEIIYIGLGSNLDDPLTQLENARSAICQIPHLTEMAYSSVYSSPPMGPQDQPDYLNSVMAVSCCLTPQALLQHLQKIENQQGRVRKQHWGARTVDLDILLFGQQQINHPDLIVPHAGLAERAFVLYPLHEIVGDELHIPGQGSLKGLLNKCPLAGLKIQQVAHG